MLCSLACFVGCSSVLFSAGLGARNAAKQRRRRSRRWLQRRGRPSEARLALRLATAPAYLRRPLTASSGTQATARTRPPSRCSGPFSPRATPAPAWRCRWTRGSISRSTAGREGAWGAWGAWSRSGSDVLLRLGLRSSVHDSLLFSLSSVARLCSHRTPLRMSACPQLSAYPCLLPGQPRARPGSGRGQLLRRHRRGAPAALRRPHSALLRVLQLRLRIRMRITIAHHLACCSLPHHRTDACLTFVPRFLHALCCVQVSADGRTVRLSQLLKWYGGDFGETQAEALRTVLGYLSEGPTRQKLVRPRLERGRSLLPLESPAEMPAEMPVAGRPSFLVLQSGTAAAFACVAESKQALRFAWPLIGSYHALCYNTRATDFSDSNFALAAPLLSPSLLSSPSSFPPPPLPLRRTIGGAFGRIRLLLAKPPPEGSELRPRRGARPLRDAPRARGRAVAPVRLGAQQRREGGGEVVSGGYRARVERRRGRAGGSLRNNRRARR